MSVGYDDTQVPLAYRLVQRPEFACDADAWLGHDPDGTAVGQIRSLEDRTNVFLERWARASADAMEAAHSQLSEYSADQIGVFRSVFAGAGVKLKPAEPRARAQFAWGAAAAAATMALLDVLADVNDSEISAEHWAKEALCELDEERFRRGSGVAASDHADILLCAAQAAFALGHHEDEFCYRGRLFTAAWEPSQHGLSVGGVVHLRRKVASQA